MFCKKCGNQLADGAKFCGVCGASQEVQANAIPEFPPVQREEMSYTIPLVREEEPVSKKVAVSKPSKKPLPMKKILVGVAALAVVVLLVVLAGSLFGGKTVYLTTEIVDNDDEFAEYVSEYAYDEDGHLIEYSYSAEYKGWYADYLDDFSYTYSYEYEDGRIVAAEYDAGDESFDLEYIYDKDGNLEAVESDDFEGEVTCDDKGRIVEMEFDGDREVSMECSYHDNGILAEMDYTRGNYRYVYVYDENGRTLEYNSYSNGEKSTSRTYEYNEDGKIVEEDYKYYYNGNLNNAEVETWEYDKKGNLIAYTSKRSDSKGQKLTMECEVITDEDTKEWVITKLSGDKGAFPSITDYLEKGDTYQEETYDEHGNCIERVIYGESENEITYEYMELKVPKNYLKPFATDPEFCQFLD